MSAAAKKSFVWLWMAALFTATVGFSVHQIYCHCLDRTTITLFAPAAEGCAALPAADAPADCCKKAAETCCTSGETSGSSSDCTDESTTVFQLKTEFLVDKPFEKTFDCPLWLPELPFFSRKLKPALCAAPNFNEAPPPESASGREICLRHQLFLS